MNIMKYQNIIKTMPPKRRTKNQSELNDYASEAYNMNS